MSWIKMRGNLWDDPRVMALCDATDAQEATIIGGLYWLWTMADQHTTDGRLPGLTPRQIDRKTGIVGFADALVRIGWIAQADGGISALKLWQDCGDSAVAQASERRRNALRIATPPWLTSSDRAAIAAIYRAARRLSYETGVPHDVDHIVPLQGRNVCGLHVPANLRPLPARDNRIKGARH